MDYFIIEMVATLRESAAVATARAKKIEQEMLEAGADPASTSSPIVVEERQLSTRFGDKPCFKNRQRSGKGLPGRGRRTGQAAAGGDWNACWL